LANPFFLGENLALSVNLGSLECSGYGECLSSEIDSIISDNLTREVTGLETVTILLNSAPYGDEKVWNALRLARALTSAAVKMKVNIFLLGDAVTTAKRGQKPPEGYYNLEKMLKELVERGVEVIACVTCINARGLTQEDLVEGVRVGTTVGDLARWVKESHKLLSF